MSGIYGFIKSQSSTNQINITSMQLWNYAYGKDTVETYETKDFSMGCCYEQISSTSHCYQPILEKKTKYSVIDAILYNREELLNLCHSDHSISDEELLLSYIDSFGLDALKNVNGDFCGAIYDTQDETLILFRDHMGVRPLFYYADDTIIAFSTDIRGLLALPQTEHKINEDWIFKTVSGYLLTDTEATEYNHIFCVKPAGYMSFSYKNNKLLTEKHSYWQLGSQKIRLASEADYQKTLRDLITDAIQRRVNVSTNLVGAELSGGLDSGIIDILINRLGKECIYFSWSADPAVIPYAENDERLVIEDICKQENIHCFYNDISFDLDSTSNIANNMQQIGIKLNYNEGMPFRYLLPPYTNTPSLSASSQFLSRKGVKIVFTGHGGDEGVSHRCNPYELFYHHEFFQYFKFMWSFTHGQKHRIIRTLKTCYINLTQTRKKLITPFQGAIAAPELLQKDFKNKFSYTKMPALHFAYDPKTYINESGSRSRLDNIALQGAYSGVRYMVPYLDYRVIDFAVSIPRHLYMHGKINRYIFREAFKDIMPPSLYQQRFKEDFSRRNIEEDPNWFEKYSKQKQEAVNKLNRKYWSKYLNFDFIDSWLNQGQPSEEDRFHDSCILSCLSTCALAQNLIDRAKEVHEINSK